MVPEDAHQLPLAPLPLSMSTQDIKGRVAEHRLACLDQGRRSCVTAAEDAREQTADIDSVCGRQAACGGRQRAQDGAQARA